MCIFSLNIAHTMAFNTTAFWFDDLLLLINFGIYDGMPDRYIHLMDTIRKWNEPLSILKISLQHTNASSLTNKMMAGKKIGVKYSNGRRGRGWGVSEQSTIPTNNNNKWIYEDTFFTLSLKWWPSIYLKGRLRMNTHSFGFAKKKKQKTDSNEKWRKRMHVLCVWCLFTSHVHKFRTKNRISIHTWHESVAQPTVL